MNETTPNVPLLRKTLDHIAAHPEGWFQPDWRCGSGMCFAGTACDLDGGEWVDDSEYVVARDDDDAEAVEDGAIHCGDRAARILGLTADQEDRLFNGGNDLDDLRRIVGELCGEQS